MNSIPRAIAKALARGIFYNLIASIGTQGSSLVATILLARTLGKAVFGDFMAAYATFNAIFLLASLAGSVTTKFVAEYLDKDRDLVARVIGLCSRIILFSGIIGTTLLAVGCYPIGEHLLKNPATVLPLLCGSLTILFQTRAFYCASLLIALGAFRRLALVSAIGGVLYVLQVWGGGKLGGAPGAGCGLTVAALTGAVGMHFAASHRLRELGIVPVFSYGSFERKILRDYVVPALLSGVVLLPATWWATVMISRSAGNQEVALFAACTQLRVLVLFLPQVVASVGMAAINRNLKSKHYQHTHLLTSALMVGATLAVMLPTAILAPRILTVFGNGFGEDSHMPLILLLSTLPESYALAMRQRVQSHRLVWPWLFAVVVPWQVVNLGLTTFWVPRMGSIGAAFAYLTGTIVFAIAVTRLIRARVLALEHVDARSIPDSQGPSSESPS